MDDPEGPWGQISGGVEWPFIAGRPITTSVDDDDYSLRGDDFIVYARETCVSLLVHCKLRSRT